jgi:phage-related protein
LGALVVGFIYQMKPAIQLAIDAFRGFVGFLQGSIKFIKDNKEELAILALGILAYTTYVSAATIAMYGLEIATKIATAAQWLFNAALTANPIGLIIAGVAALAAGVVYAWKHFEGFRGAIMGAWQVLKDLGGFIQNFFIKQLSGIGNVIAGIFTFDLDLIKQGLTQAVDAYTDFGKDAAVSFAKGYQNGVKSFEDDNKKDEKSIFVPKTANAAASDGITDTAIANTGDKVTGTSTGRTQGKATTINITIEKLVEKFEIQTTNINESAGKVKDMVQRAIISALNDSQIVAGK